MRTVLLGDIVSFLARGSAPKYTEKVDFYVLNQKCIRDWRVSLEQARFTDADQKKVSSDRVLQVNDILVNSTGQGTLGRVGQFFGADKPTTVDSHVTIARPNQEKVNPIYLGYALKYREKEIELMAEGSTGQTELSRFKLAQLKILLPDSTTQKKIADILGSIDEKIELNRKMNETLEQMGQALFRHYFIDNPEAEKWNRVPISALCDKVASGGTPATKREDYYGGEVQWYSTKELKDGFLFGSEKTITNDGLGNSSAKLFPKHTVMMAIYAAPTVGRLGILTSEASFNQATCGLVANPRIGYEFIYLYLLMSRAELNNMANGAAQQNISVGKVRDFKVMNPDDITIEDFRKKIEPVFAQVKTNSEQIHTLTALRETLLPRLINGKMKV